MRLGLALSLVPAASSGVAAIEPATLSLTGWWRAANGGEYDGAPWAGTASAGTSGTLSLTEATNPPAVGAAVNGHSGADFDGVNDKLAADAFGNIFTNSDGSAWCLFNADAATADPGAATFYTLPGFLVDSADRFSFAFSSAGVILGSYNGTDFSRIAVACATGGWHLAQCRWSGGVMELRVDGGAWTTTARTILSAGGTLRVGSNDGATAFYNGRIQDLGATNSRLSDATFDGLLSYARARYALAL